MEYHLHWRMSRSLVSCLVVTKGTPERLRGLATAIRCFAQPTYAPLALVAYCYLGLRALAGRSGGLLAASVCSGDGEFELTEDGGQ
jgi:hypothetical protein